MHWYPESIFQCLAHSKQSLERTVGSYAAEVVSAPNVSGSERRAKGAHLVSENQIRVDVEIRKILVTLSCFQMCQESPQKSHEALKDAS